MSNIPIRLSRSQKKNRPRQENHANHCRNRSANLHPITKKIIPPVFVNMMEANAHIDACPNNESYNDGVAEHNQPECHCVPRSKQVWRGVHSHRFANKSVSPTGHPINGLLKSPTWVDRNRAKCEEKTAGENVWFRPFYCHPSGLNFNSGRCGGIAGAQPANFWESSGLTQAVDLPSIGAALHATARTKIQLP